ncbi:hypothetical protein H6G81_00120 [Scytonema hofmannii FACHB-248]|uniref:Uncharacterized protein n=1 Tax=Scytonema hofmannii FACHB-248 TaxID=1842502 RepID=A0ABR8GIA6_9CYAN|nr:MULTISPECIES: hypothetical protein [Nostocales]MBD2602961.1 hypothetical protein [Scytonema hofmannii FACHB-248]
MRKHKTGAQKSLLTLLLGISLTTISLLSIQPSTAQTEASDAPLELELLDNPKGVITANTINQGQLTIPSLWWAKENSENKLLDNWIAYPAEGTQPARVDVIVNQQYWSILDYLERYNFVNRVGSLAKNYGYNIRVFNYQQERLATYTCNFNTSPTLCRIDFNNQNKLGLRRSS